MQRKAKGKPGCTKSEAIIHRVIRVAGGNPVASTGRGPSIPVKCVKRNNATMRRRGSAHPPGRAMDRIMCRKQLAQQKFYGSRKRVSRRCTDRGQGHASLRRGCAILCASSNAQQTLQSNPSLHLKLTSSPAGHLPLATQIPTSTSARLPPMQSRCVAQFMCNFDSWYVVIPPWTTTAGRESHRGYRTLQ